ncbi:MAG: hypothetical protein EZS28_033148, partial [Streblomastix strix]
MCVNPGPVKDTMPFKP